MSQVDLIGKYEVKSVIGKGSTGVVYKALDPGIGRNVAIKTLNSSVALDQVFGEEDTLALERFKVESRSAGKLRHPNIIMVYDTGNTPSGKPFIVMEFVEGDNLDTVIAEKVKLDPLHCIHYLYQIASAVDYAHSEGVIHRDIKPANILIDSQNQPLLLDFGVAKLADTSITMADTVVGTPSYMAPEQIRGRPLSGRTDLFSLGVVAFEILVGSRPFPGKDFSEVVTHIVQRDPISFEKLGVSFPEKTEKVLKKALSRDPENRYETAVEFISELSDALSIKANERGVVEFDPENSWSPVEDKSKLDRENEETPSASRKAGFEKVDSKKNSGSDSGRNFDASAELETVGNGFKESKAELDKLVAKVESQSSGISSEVNVAAATICGGFEMLEKAKEEQSFDASQDEEARDTKDVKEVKETRSKKSKNRKNSKKKNRDIQAADSKKDNKAEIEHETGVVVEVEEDKKAIEADFNNNKAELEKLVAKVEAQSSNVSSDVNVAAATICGGFDLLEKEKDVANLDSVEKNVEVGNERLRATDYSELDKKRVEAVRNKYKKPLHALGLIATLGLILGLLFMELVVEDSKEEILDSSTLARNGVLTPVAEDPEAAVEAEGKKFEPSKPDVQLFNDGSYNLMTDQELAWMLRENDLSNGDTLVNVMTEIGERKDSRLMNYMAWVFPDTDAPVKIQIVKSLSGAAFKDRKQAREIVKFAMNDMDYLVRGFAAKYAKQFGLEDELIEMLKREENGVVRKIISRSLK